MPKQPSGLFACCVFTASRSSSFVCPLLARNASIFFSNWSKSYTLVYSSLCSSASRSKTSLFFLAKSSTKCSIPVLSLKNHSSNLSNMLVS
eukprot:05291_6